MVGSPGGHKGEGIALRDPLVNWKTLLPPLLLLLRCAISAAATLARGPWFGAHAWCVKLSWLVELQRTAQPERGEGKREEGASR